MRARRRPIGTGLRPTLYATASQPSDLRSRTLKTVPREAKLIAGYLNWATETLRGWGVGESLLHFCATILIAGGALLLAWLLYFVVTRYVIPAVLKLVRITDASWDDILFNERLLRVVAELACVMLMQATIPTD